ncbi:MAG: AAA family ATPase [Hyphomicrobiaceae bacterium]
MRGEPGIGKTRLATECLAFAARQTFATHHVLVLDFGAATGTDPLRAVFQSLLGLSEAAASNALTDAAHGLLLESDFGADDEAFVFDLLDLPLSVDALAFYGAIENTTRNRRKIDLVARMLEKRAREQPQIVLIEDMHWADPVTMDLCACLVARSSDCSAVILMTSRVEGDPFDSEWRALTGTTSIYTVDLRPLSQHETQQLAAVAGGIKRRGWPPRW